MVALRDAGVQERAEALRALYECQKTPVWGGVPLDKGAQDLLAYQEILTVTRPEIVVECGAWLGGSGLFFADICALNGAGQVLSVDITLPDVLPVHPRLQFLQGDSVAPDTIATVLQWAAGRTGFVILDSAHDKAHVLAEMDAYAPLVAVGCFLIVEDTNINGHPLLPAFGPGPWEAVEEWLASHPAFVMDTEAEPYLTFAPGGYLQRRY